MTRLPVSPLVLAVLMLLIATTCSDRPSSPSPPVLPMTGLEISGRAALAAVGQITQLTATALFFDGSRQDVTRVTTWNSSNTEVVRISNAGVMTAVGFGQARAEAVYRSQASQLDVRVIQTGAFILTGSVTEPVDVPIVHARVEVVGGTPKGLWTATEADGSFELFGVSGTVTVKASRRGYVTEEKSVTMSGDRRVNLELAPTIPPARIAGRYQLVFRASDACGHLPREARQRTYRAVVEQVGSAVEIRLGGADFEESCDSMPANRFSGFMKGNLLFFTLNDPAFYPYYYNSCYDLHERMTQDSTLAIVGEASGSASASGLQVSGSLSGAFHVLGRAGQATCPARDHQFAFTR